jgi:hypothetical protein
MFDIALLIFFVVMAYRVCIGVNREAEILREFGQSTNLAIAAILFPFGPVILLIGPSLFAFPIAYILAAGCYLPPLLIARRYGRTLEVTGTDRVQRAQTVVSQATVSSLVGLAYVSATFALSFAVLAL